MREYVQILWRDATSEDAWTEIKDIHPECHLIETVGHVIIENEQTLTVALNRDPMGESCSQFIHIPKVWIEKRIAFKIDS